MTPTEVASVVAFMAEAWPWAELGDHAVEVWADACPNVDPNTGHTAARRLVRTEERPPSIARFLTECRLIDRETRQPSIGAGPASTTDQHSAADKVRAIRAFWRAASADRPEHDHRGTDENPVCPRCSTSADYVAEHSPQIMAVLREPVR